MRGDGRRGRVATRRVARRIRDVARAWPVRSLVRARARANQNRTRKRARIFSILIRMCNNADPIAYSAFARAQSQLHSCWRREHAYSSQPPFCGHRSHAARSDLRGFALSIGCALSIALLQQESPSYPEYTHSHIVMCSEWFAHNEL